MLQRLPVGIQTFAKLREGNYLYVDKTEHIHHLLDKAGYYFLSRPRRFGKSLLLSTIKEIYQGNRALFSGLWIEDRWDWGKKHPVLHLSFASMGYRTLGLEAAIAAELQSIGQQLGLTLPKGEIDRQFRDLLRQLATRDGKVVLLIDEYDKPLIDYLDDIPLAKTNQQVMKTFYSVVKDSDPHIEFLLITGVSKFSRVSLFSDLNNLYDLTLDYDTAGLLGYTQTELEHYFTPYMPAVEQRLKLDRSTLLAQLRDWYNGYTWNLDVSVYNPFSVLSFFQAKAFRNFWFETGTPTFLPKLMRREKVYRLNTFKVDELTLGNYDLDRLQLIPVMFQTGYLTFQSQDANGMYWLDYPNREVRRSMLTFLLAEWAHVEPAYSAPMVLQLLEAFQHDDIPAVIELIKTVFKKIPYPIFIQDREAYYHSLIYLTFFYLGQYAEAEVNESNGRVDCVVKTPSHIYIIEFKLDESAQAAMKQIKSRDYAGAFRDDPRPKVLLGMNFSSALKGVDDWVVEAG